MKRLVTLILLAAALTPGTAAARIPTLVSNNWAGYAVVTAPGQAYGATATFRIPAARCAKSDDLEASAFWTGLGGFTAGNKTLIQNGIVAICYQGAMYYYGWTEVLPDTMRYTELQPTPGQTVTLTTLYYRGWFYLQVGPDVFKTKARVRRDSAEVIAEAPTGGTGVLPLSPFGSVTFRKLLVWLTGPSKTYRVNMRSPLGDTLTTSGLTGGGSVFTVRGPV